MTNYMPSPFDPEEWTPDPDGTITNVTLDNPSGSNFIGLAEQTSSSVFIFNNNIILNPLPVAIGEDVYLCLICKKISDIFIQFEMIDSVGVLARARYNPLDGSKESGFPGYQQNITYLTDGFVLVEVKYTTTRMDSGLFGKLSLSTADGNVPPIGSQLYAQAAFFGKADDFPANVMPTL